MTGINHILTGGIIAGAMAHPVAIPLAFASHFVLDALPHYAYGDDNPRSGDPVWKVDSLLILTFFYILLSLGLASGAWIAAGAVAAFSPDIILVYRFFGQERLGRVKPRALSSSFNEFHKNIQHHETRTGIVDEIIFFVASLWLFDRLFL